MATIIVTIIDILALILLCWINKNNAEGLGKKGSKYIFSTLLIFIAFEIAGAAAALLGKGDKNSALALAMIFGVVGGMISYFFAKKEPVAAVHQKTGIGDIILTTILLIITIIFVFPFYWVVTGSFRVVKTAVKVPEWWPLHPTMVNYQDLFKNPALQWFNNSLIIALGTMVLVCIVSALAGYVLAKKKFPGRDLIFSLFVGAMALPKQVVLVPLVQLVSSWGMHNTLWAVILPAVGWPFGVFLMKQFSETVPNEILEAAKMDGCSEIQTFTDVVVPIVKPGLGALAIFTFITAWNDYFMQLIMLNSREKLTLQLGVATLQSEFSTNYGVLMAGATLAALPIVIIFVLFQKAFTQGITMGAVKG